MTTRTLLAATLLLSLGACAADTDDDSLEPASCTDAKCDDNSATGFEVFKGQDGKYYFHLVATNGKIAMRSQAYTTKAKAKKGVASVQANGTELTSYQLLESADGEFYFNLRAANGEVIATSETYTRKYSAQRGIAAAAELVAESDKARAAVTGSARFLVFRGQDNQYYFHLRAKNGEIVLQSEGYVAPGGVKNGIESVRAAAADADAYSVRAGKDGQYYFVLQAGNGAVIARSETYASKASAQRAVDAVVAIFEAGGVLDPKSYPPLLERDLNETAYPKLDALADAAADGRSIAYFGYALNAAKPSGADCQDMDATSAAAVFAEGVDVVVGAADTGLGENALTRLKVDFRSWLGQDDYQVCTVDTSTGLTMGNATYILSRQNKGPRFVFELGYDD